MKIVFLTLKNCYLQNFRPLSCHRMIHFTYGMQCQGRSEEFVQIPHHVVQLLCVETSRKRRLVSFSKREIELYLRYTMADICTKRS